MKKFLFFIISICFFNSLIAQNYPDRKERDKDKAEFFRAYKQAGPEEINAIHQLREYFPKQIRLAGRLFILKSGDPYWQGSPPDISSLIWMANYFSEDSTHLAIVRGNKLSGFIENKNSSDRIQFELKDALAWLVLPNYMILPD